MEITLENDRTRMVAQPQPLLRIGLESFGRGEVDGCIRSSDFGPVCILEVVLRNYSFGIYRCAKP